MTKRVFSSFSTKAFIINIMIFMVLVNTIIFVQGIFSPEGYIFDFRSFIYDKIPAGTLLSFAAAIIFKR